MDKTFTFKRPLWTRLVNAPGKLASIFGSAQSSINVKALMAKASKRTGLNDFGSDTFREGLNVLVDSINRESRLHTIGRIGISGMLVNSLEVRLKAQHWVKEHPEVLDEQIEKPFIIVGLPRTGTTILSFLLDMDPENRSLVHWQAQDPVPPPELASMNEDPRIMEAAKKLKMLNRVLPNFRAIHPIEATMPTECIELFSHEFKQPMYSMFGVVHSYVEWFKQTDMESAYRYHKFLLQILQSRVPTQTWSLKAPLHLWLLDVVEKVYPDARVIITHRDLQKVIPSVCSLVKAFRSCFSDRIDTSDIGDEIMTRFKRGVEKAMEYEDGPGNLEIYHLQYNDFIKDPVNAVSKIYENFGLEPRPLHKKNMEAWMKFNPKNKHGKHSYSLSDYGLTSPQVKDTFKEYAARYNIPLEDKG